METNYIYKIKNNINNKIYIGVSVNPKERFRFHCLSSNKNLIGLAINKYGKENFKLEILLCGPKDYCYEMEPIMIKEYNTIRPNGYNIAKGGENPPHLKGQNHPLYGKKLSLKEKENLRNKNLGKKYSMESKLKRSKLSREDIENIHILHAKFGSYNALGKHLGVSAVVVKRYIDGVTLPEITRKGKPYIKPEYKPNQIYTYKNNIKECIIPLTKDEKEFIEIERRRKIGLAFSGENSPISKLTNDQVHNICKLLKDKKDGLISLTHNEIANKFNCKLGTISQISGKRNWKSISKDYF